MTRIRRSRPADGEALRRLNRRALREAGTDPEDVPDVEDLAEVQSAYIESGGEFLVAERDGDLVGMGGLQVDGIEGELFRMRVAPDHQGEGIGSRLLAALEEVARERGVRRLYAETARRQTAALSFYPANGYEQVEERSLEEYDLVTFLKQLDTEGSD